MVTITCWTDNHCDACAKERLVTGSSLVWGMENKVTPWRLRNQMQERIVVFLWTKEEKQLSVLCSRFSITNRLEDSPLMEVDLLLEVYANQFKKTFRAFKVAEGSLLLQTNWIHFTPSSPFVPTLTSDCNDAMNIVLLATRGLLKFSLSGHIQNKIWEHLPAILAACAGYADTLTYTVKLC
jgi:hypothetical protein